MVDWWQALLLVLAGGLISVPTAYATHCWTTKASRQAEERQAIRQLRRERMQPILDFLDAAKQAAARQGIVDVLDEEYQRLSPEDAEPLERWQKMRNELLQADPAGIQEMRAYQTAQFASISIPALMRELFRIHAALVIRSDAKILGQFGPALRSAEGLIELYLAGSEVQEPSSDKRSQ